jgi:hypothetical protein
MATRRTNLAARALRDEQPAQQVTQTPLVLLGDGSNYPPRPSPARALQARLADATGIPMTDVQESERWSPRATLLFVVSVCGAFWVAMGGALVVVLR